MNRQSDFDEIDSADHELVFDHGVPVDKIYPDPRIVFDDTYCTECGAGIGPGLGEDEETGHPFEVWTHCYTDGVALICDDCLDKKEE